MNFLNNDFFGFTNNSSKKNSTLFVVDDLSRLVKSKIITQKEKSYIIENYKNADVFTKPDFVKDVLLSITVLKPSTIHRNSTIDNSAKISKKLKNRTWNIEFSKSFSETDIYDFLIGWGLSFYKFSFNKNKDNKKLLNLKSLKSFPIRLQDHCKTELKGIFLARNLINLPANMLNPSEYEKIIKKNFKNKNIHIKTYKGNNFKSQFPLIYSVGRSSEYQPRLIEINWKSKKNNPNIIIIGKGITFDTGGLDIKPSSGMLLMKKDMGGSAVAIALTKILIELNFKINLKLLVPIAENAISEKSMRPMDVVFSRNKTPVEIGNTDAEGRLILADTITFAQEGETKVDLIIDFATLTGAARVALGTEMPALFSNNKKIAKTILDNSLKKNDPLWELPLFNSYQRFLKNENGTLSSTGFSGTGGAITAALFLQKFLKNNVNWVHVDMMGWNLTDRPGYPKGGEASSIRALLYALNELFN